MTCSSCGFINEEGSQLCAVCGEKLSPPPAPLADAQEKLCPECGNRGEGWLGLCPKCGTMMTDEGTPLLDNPASLAPPESDEQGDREALGDEEENFAPEEVSMKQVNSTLDTLLSDLLEIEMREKERNDRLEEMDELSPSLYSDREDRSEKGRLLPRRPILSPQTRSMLEWFLIFTLIFTLFIFGISAGLWSSIQLL